MRNFKKLFVITTAFVVMFCNVFQSFAAARFNKPEMASMEAVKTAGSWNQDADGRWSFTPTGEEPVKDGWFYVNSGNSSSEYKWYCFDENGIMRTGWIADKNDPSIWYYAGETKDASEGSIITGWITDPQDGKKYYLDPATGIMVSGWRQIGRKWYYFGERQYADRSWAPDNTGHITVGAKGTHSYGAMYTNEYTPDGYYVGPDGAWNSNLPGSSGSGRHDPVVITYTVTFNINGHGTAPGAQIVKAGSTVSEPTPQPSAEGFIFGGWFKEPACENRWDFASGKVTSDVTLYAKWTEIDQVTIIYQSEAENKGTVSPTSESINPETGTATGSKASPSDGYGFINWTNAAGNIVGTNETFIPEKKDGKYAEETYTAHFEALTYKVTFKGNVIGYTDQTIDETYDTHYILPAESPIKTGYAFSGWYTVVEDGTEITSDTVVKITEDTDLYAQYTPLSYQTVFYGNYEGSKYAETISECYDSNFVLPETNPERTGYTFSGWWTKSEGGNQITTQTRVDASVRGAYAHWIADTHRVTAQVAGSHGSASAKIGDAEVTEAKTDENVTFAAVPDAGYAFDHWEVVSGGIDIDSVKTDNPLTVAMPATALTLKAHFRAVVPGEYNIILEDDGHGTATAKVNGSAVTTAAPDSSVTLIATPGEAYVFKEWSVARGLNDGAITDNTFTMPSNEVKIKAIFEREYTVEVTAQGHGSASADFIKGVSGTEVTLTVTPEDGYKLDSLSVERGGISITDNKFTIGSADVKIKAVFVADTPDTYNIILEDDGHGTAIAKVNGSEVTSAAPGSSVTLIATPNEGYVFKEWNIIRGIESSDISDNTFTMPSKEVKIKAIFVQKHPVKVPIDAIVVSGANIDSLEVNLDTLVAKGTSLVIFENDIFSKRNEDAVKALIESLEEKGIASHIRVPVWCEDGKFIDPLTDPEHQAFRQDIVDQRKADIEKYLKLGFSGINLDMIMFNGNAEKYGVENACNAINETVKQLSEKVYSVSADAVVSAMIKPEIIGDFNKSLYGQDVTVLSKYLDVICPEIFKDQYGKDAEWIRSVTEEFCKQSSGIAVVTGVCNYNKEGAALSYDTLMNDAKHAIDGGSKGVLIDQYGKGEIPDFSTLGGFNIILEDDGHGTAKAKVGEREVTFAAPDAAVTLAATPNEGYAFKEWNIVRGLSDGAITDSTFTMPSNEVKIKAIFEREYTVEVTAQGHGSASADFIKGVSGTEVTLTVTPEDGYKLDSLSVERGGISITDNKFTIGSADVKIKAVFVADTPDTYSIILEGDGHGTAIAKVNGSEVTSAAPGASVTLIATPNEGYAFKEWNIVRGLSNSAITDNTFTMPTNEVKIKAIFDRAYNINVQVQGHGSASATVDGQTATCARKDASVTLTATPEDGYELKGWTVVSGNITISDNAFTMPEGNVTVKAVFSEALDPGLWIPMTANDKYGSPINFYPAFKNANEMEGYKFAVKDGNVFTEISSTDISMEKIYQALQLSTGTTTTLYYAKTDSEAPELKGYTVKDFSWNEVFEAYESSYPAKATGYVNGFKTFYQGIVTAEIGDVTDNKYGIDWDAKPTQVPKINGVFYTDFYNSYGGNYGGILSSNSNLPWCSTIESSANAYAFSTIVGGVILEPRSKKSGVVLCKSFGTDAPVKYNITLDNDGHGTAVAKVDGSVVTSAAAGETVTLIASPSEGYELKEWKTIPEDLEIQSDNTFIMPDCDVTVKAVFIESTPVTKYKITLENDGNGLAMAKVGDTVVTSAAAGETVKLTVTPSDGYDFESWEPTPNILVIGTDNTFIMPACDVTVKANFEEASYYAVCIWDIEEEPDGSQMIIFGPATGPDYDTAIRNATEIEDDWDTISANVAAGTARQIYSTALAGGHIKKIKITLNNDIFSGTKPTGTFSTFHTSIKSDYRKWNYTYSSTDYESANYATSRIRATLNGRNGWDPSSYAGENLLDDSKCLLSCFPEDLQRNIAARTFNVPTQWDTSGSYPIMQYVEISDKLWLANATEIYGVDTPSTYADYGSQFQKNQSAGISISSYAKNKVYAENGTAQYCWLRSPYRSVNNEAAAIHTTGKCSNGIVTYTYGISPFFIIGGSAPETCTYYLASDGNGSWKEDELNVESFITTDASAPAVSETGSITYTGTDGQEHTVTATPNTGYTFKECSYDTNTKTYTASFEAVSSYDIGCDIDGQDETYEVIFYSKKGVIDSPIKINGTYWYYSAFRQIDDHDSCIGLFVLLKKEKVPSSNDFDYVIIIHAFEGYQLTNCKFGDITITCGTEAPHIGLVTASQNLAAKIEAVPSVGYMLTFDAKGCKDYPEIITGIPSNSTYITEANKLTIKKPDGTQLKEIEVTPDNDHEGTAIWHPSTGTINEDTCVTVVFAEKSSYLTSNECEEVGAVEKISDEGNLGENPVENLPIAENTNTAANQAETKEKSQDDSSEE